VSEMNAKDLEMREAATVSGASALMRELWPTGSVKERIGKAARELGWPFSRAENMWRGESRVIVGEETVRLLEVRAARSAATTRKLEEAAHDFEDVAGRLARMETLLAALVADLDHARAVSNGGPAGTVGMGDDARDPRVPADRDGRGRSASHSARAVLRLGRRGES